MQQSTKTGQDLKWQVVKDIDSPIYTLLSYPEWEAQKDSFELVETYVGTWQQAKDRLDELLTPNLDL